MAWRARDTTLVRNWIVNDWSFGLALTQQNLLETKPYSVNDIIDKIRVEKRQKDQRQEVWNELNDCLRNSPIVQKALDEAHIEWSKAWLESWDVDIMGLELGGKIGYHSYEGVRLLSRANVMSIATTLILGALLSGVPQQTSKDIEKKYGEKIHPVLEDCLRKTADKYGFLGFPPKP